MPQKTKKPELTFADKCTEWVGSPFSLVVHTIFFAGCFALGFLGIPWNNVLLVLTTAVSLEAIYLAILIQMTVNRHTESLEEFEDDIDEIQAGIDDIQVDVDEIQEDVDDLRDDIDLSSEEELSDTKAIEAIQQNLQKLIEDIEKLKSKVGQ